MNNNNNNNNNKKRSKTLCLGDLITIQSMLAIVCVCLSTGARGTELPPPF